MSKKSKKSSKLKHVAIICDGNRRWARQRGWDVFRGHEKAVEVTMEELVDEAVVLGIPYLTFWIFSTENWKRSKREVKWLMDLFRRAFDEMVPKLHEKNIRVRVIGRRHELDEDIQERIERGEELTKNNTDITVILALNYGGRDELVRATREIMRAAEKGELKPEDLDEQTFESYLEAPDIPDPDLIIRTGGELRLSGFMLWQQQYSEFLFPETLFPDFDGKELRKAVKDYRRRHRRFGGG